MFGIGFSELALIVLVVIVFIRPDDLPAFFRKAGRAYAELKKAYDEIAAVKDDFLREMDVAAAVQEAERPPKTAPAPDSAGKPEEALPAENEKPYPDGGTADGSD
jgi:Sec-independent protein translocase protein TatA